MNYINKRFQSGHTNRKYSLSHLLYTTYIYGTIALFLAIIIGGAGCRKTFVTNPSNSITEADRKGEKVTQAFLDGVYRHLREKFYYRDNSLGSAAVGLATDLMAEDIGTKQINAFTGFYNYSIPASETDAWTAGVWNFYYVIISNVNYVILQENALNEQKAQALALRAYAYYNLINLFANWKKDSTKTKVIPVNLTVGIDPPPLMTAQQVYDQIDKDLLESIKLFKEAKNFTKVNKSNIDSFVAHGLLARSYLFRGKFQQAKEQACLALGKNSTSGTNLDGSDLMDTTEYKEGFNNIDNKEWMWGLPVNNAQLENFASFTAHMDPTSPGGASTAPNFMAFTLYDSMCTKDVRRRVVIPPTGSGTSIMSKVKVGDSFDLVSLKFRDPNSPWDPIAENYIKLRKKASAITPSWLAAYPLMRKAEMYLIIAECNTNSGTSCTCNGSGSNCPICCLRKKRMEGNNTACCTGNNHCNKDTVYKERRRELWGEGFALYDLKRLSRPVKRDSTHQQALINNNIYYVSAGSDSLTFYIPQDVLNTNPNYGGTQPRNK